MAYKREGRVAELAVQKATLLTQKVFREKAKGTLSKDDTSPVTMGDYGAQAIVIQAIRKNFPEDEVIAEEDAASLRENKALSHQMWNLVKDIRLADIESDNLVGGPLESEEMMLDMIDEGKSAGGAKRRVWALDPIDGTKGFIRGDQYAVCLALIVDGNVKVGVIGCPNLPISDSLSLSASIESKHIGNSQRGVLFSAVAGSGAVSRPLSSGVLTDSKPISMRSVTDITKAIFCESVEAAHASQDDHAALAKRLGITAPSVRLDSQAKYCTVACGAADIYLRLPVKDRVEKIWDHAAGYLLVLEAGGQVSDMHGARLDFTKGRELAANKGVVVSATRAIHSQVVDAIQAVLVPS